MANKKKKIEQYTPLSKVLTVVFAVMSLIWLFPIFEVIINSFKENSFVILNPFALPNEESFVGWANLGIVEARDHKSFVMADIPGIIEGAHEGKGLGTRFLRHIERNSVLLFMVPADSDDIAKDYEILLGELTQYNPELLDKERLLAITKCDMLDDELIEQMKAHLPEGVSSVFISSVSGLNISRLKDMLWEALQH